MESSEEELNFEAKIDLAELKKVNMVSMSYDFDVALDDFESQVWSVYPRAGDGLLDFLIKDRDVSLCPRCNTIFDVEAVAIFKKERMKKELAFREEKACQRNSRIEMLSIDGNHSGDIEDLFEASIAITVVEPEDT
ncbi:hypothetical protein Ahy_A05g025493 [Arachis hypogaea]|uniref:Uncharacterized protein n=1 Tax=Arachis hypogaea TaxID=3818 RepID=A0A445D8U4_ARAHY|nr:hypothetical protein Ahy_A05g025493 [Arachis hypogaea]